MPAPFTLRFFALAFACCAAAHAEQLTLLHVGDQESWLISAQGKLRDDPAQPISFYGGIDRLAAVIGEATAAAQAAGHSVLKLNAGDALLPGPRLDASLRQLATAHADGGQDFYDAIALRRIGFDALVFGNHEFDLGSDLAARFAEVSATPYLSANLDFAATARFAALAAAGRVAPSTVVSTRGGRKIGIVGVTTPQLPSLSSPAPGSLLADTPSTDLQDKVRALLPLVQAQVDALRAQQGVGTVIVVSHLQSIDNDRTLLVPGLSGVDLLISGGGHELMADANDALIAGGVAPSFSTHPIHANDRDGRPVAIVSAHFGNRYVGELNLTINDSDGRLKSIDSMRMLRVSGAPADADRVAGDPAIYAQAVKPVQDYIAALDREVIGRTAVKLNGPTHVACEITAPASSCTYTAGVRNAETGLGNLIADAMRFAGRAEVAIQNGGGIRNNLAGPGAVTVGDTVNVLPFTNLVKRAPAMNAAQLKDLMEHAVAASTPTGSPQGRYAQVSGFRVDYDTRRSARTTQGSGERIRRLVLDDGTLLVDDGRVVDHQRSFSFATIDFSANGGDGFPFAANGVVFENAVYTVSYQEAFANYLKASKSEGGLQRLHGEGSDDGDEVTANLYGAEDPYDRHGRLVDLAIAQTRPGLTRNGTARSETLIGSAGDDIITGAGGADTLSGGAGGDRFVYVRPNDGGKTGDVITDFTPYADRIDVHGLLAHIGCRVAAGCRPFADSYLKLTDVAGGALVAIDADGSGPAAARALVTLKGLTARQVVPKRDFVY